MSVLSFVRNIRATKAVQRWLIDEANKMVKADTEQDEEAKLLHYFVLRSINK